MQVLNLLLYSLREKEPDCKLLDFLRADEHLVDIGDDLVDYEVTARVESVVKVALHDNNWGCIAFYHSS